MTKCVFAALSIETILRYSLADLMTVLEVVHGSCSRTSAGGGRLSCANRLAATISLTAGDTPSLLRTPETSPLNTFQNEVSVTLAVAEYFFAALSVKTTPCCSVTELITILSWFYRSSAGRTLMVSCCGRTTDGSGRSYLSSATSLARPALLCQDTGGRLSAE